MMVSDSNSDSSGQLFRAQDIFLARQPILNRDQVLIAYELLFRRADSIRADVTDDVSATASVIAHATELGMENVLGSALGFFNIDSFVLMSDFIKFLPPQKVVLEILETVEITSKVVARVIELGKLGYKFAIDDVVEHTPALQSLLPYISIIKIDIAGMPKERLKELFGRFQGAGKMMLAEKVETIEEFNYCLALGFDYFQGYYFAKPVVMAGKKLTPSQLLIVQMMAHLDADADTVVLEGSLKHDAALGLTLLRLVNTPAVGAAHRIDSLKQALNILGRRQLYRWLQIVLYADPSRPHHSIPPLLLMASSRGKLLELMAQKLYRGKSGMSDIAFTVGIMSLMDTLFGLPMPDILQHMPVAPEVSEALLSREGIFGDMLRLVEHIERGDASEATLIDALEAIGLSHDDLYEMQLIAYEWSDSIGRSV